MQQSQCSDDDLVRARYPLKRWDRATLLGFLELTDEGALALGARVAKSGLRLLESHAEAMARLPRRRGPEDLASPRKVLGLSVAEPWRDPQGQRSSSVARHLITGPHREVDWNGSGILGSDLGECLLR